MKKKLVKIMVALYIKKQNKKKTEKLPIMW